MSSLGAVCVLSKQSLSEFGHLRNPLFRSRSRSSLIQQLSARCNHFAKIICQLRQGRQQKSWRAKEEPDSEFLLKGQCQDPGKPRGVPWESDALDGGVLAASLPANTVDVLEIWKTTYIDSIILSTLCVWVVGRLRKERSFHAMLNLNFWLAVDLC